MVRQIALPVSKSHGQWAGHRRGVCCCVGGASFWARLGPTAMPDFANHSPFGGSAAKLLPQFSMVEVTKRQSFLTVHAGGLVKTLGGGDLLLTSMLVELQPKVLFSVKWLALGPL